MRHFVCIGGRMEKIEFVDKKLRRRVRSKLLRYLSRMPAEKASTFLRDMVEALSEVKKQKGQGLVEYTLIVLLVALGFWVAIKSTDIGNRLASGWSSVSACVDDPSGCTSSS